MRTQPKFPLPQPVPTTPIRGRGIVRCDFHSQSLRDLAKRLRIRLNLHHSPIKPHRNSVGVIWRNQVFWWSTKGFYRMGKSRQPRRTFHHVLWEHYHGRPVPRGYEVFFRDRDYHNFTRANLELLSKSECHERIHLLGENNQPSLAERKQIAIKRWTKQENKMTATLLDKFNRGDIPLAATLKEHGL